MKSFTIRAFAFFVFALLCTAVFATAAQASRAEPSVDFTVENIILHKAGEAEIIGYFENTCDQGARVRWFELDLTFFAADGQEIWSGAGIRQNVNDLYVAPKERVAYTSKSGTRALPHPPKQFVFAIIPTHTGETTPAEG